MVSAAKIAHALGDARREGRAWRCRCPLHGGRSLVVKDGLEQLLITCWAGCDRLEVLSELRRCGLLEENSQPERKDFRVTRRLLREDSQTETRRIARALGIWTQAQPGSGTLVEVYLRSRGITLHPWPITLRFRPQCPRPRNHAGELLAPLPAMVGLVVHVQRGPIAVHMTYLTPDGTSKAASEPAKAFLGPVAGGAVRLGYVRPGDWLIQAEGIETAASVASCCAMPAWAALSAGGIKRVVLPSEASHVIICADNDANGVGQRAADEAAERLLAEGRRVRVIAPPNPDSDFNDILLGDPNS
jgi:hypothetical protein